MLRFSHIFASVVREILEARLLHQVFPDSLTPAQFHLLKTISLEGGRQMSEVADFLGVSMPAGTKVIDKFERLGLVRRTPGKADRRVRVISASPRGKKLVRDYEKLVAERLAATLPLFTCAEVNRFTLMLERLSLELARPGRNGTGTCVWCAGYWAPDCAVGTLFGGCPFVKLRAAEPARGDLKE